jgi:hypothetical protein
VSKAANQVTLQAQVLIDAIDQNREALAGVLDKIHEDMGNKFIVKRDPDGHQVPIDPDQTHLARVMLANYVAAFLAGEVPDVGEVSDSIINFYDTGYSHGSAYAEARQSQLN